MSTTQTGVTLGADLWSVGGIFLATGTQVAGSVTTGGSLTEQTGVTVGGAIAQYQTLSPATTSLTIAFPSSSTNVTLQPGQSMTLSPGAFASVTVNSRATLTLTSGTYYFDGIDIEPQGTIALSGAGPFVLNIRTSFAAKGQITLPAVSPAPTLIVTDAGTQDVFLQAEFDGTLIAPGANVTLAAIGSQSYHGAFIGKSLTLQAGVTVLHRGTGAGTVAPVAECIIKQSTGSYQAVFGYSASSLLGNVNIPIGANNQFEPAPTGRGQPQTFSPGRHTAQVAVPFDGHALAWKLGGLSASATLALPTCTAACVQHLTTPGQPRIDTLLSTAAVPLSVDESVVQRDSFRWDDTLPVPETFSDGSSRMYYGLVYLDSQDSLQVMDALRINYDNIPLFDTETTAFQQQGLRLLSYPFDGQGQFAFALLPGATYNAIRQAALDPTQPAEIFQAVQLRSMPAADSQLTVQTSCGLTPVAQCVARAANGSLRAVFSYNNPAAQPVTVPIGPDNALTGGSGGALPPEAFNAGSHTAVFAVPFNSGATVRWQLQGTTVSVSTSSATCSSTIVNQIGVDVFKPFPPAAPSACRSRTPAEGQYPNSSLPPAARVNTCNSLSYTYAGTLGFQWRGVASDADDTRAQAALAALALQSSGTMGASLVQTGSTGVLQPVARPEWFGHLFHAIVQTVANAAASAVDGVRRGLTSVVGVFTGSTNVTITANPLNTDSFFNPNNTTTTVAQAWGKDFGSAISLQGLQVRSQKSLFLSVADLNSSNQGSVKVLNHLGSHICFNVRNNAVQVVDFSTLPVTVCPQDSSAQIGGSPPSTKTVNVQYPEVNTLAQMTDARKYMHNVAGFDNAQAEVLVGLVADAIGALNQNRAFTPCWSFSWANDVATFMTALGAVAADLGNEWLVGEIENGAKYIEGGLGKTLTKAQGLAAQMNAISIAAAGTPQASQANAALAAANASVAQIQAAQKTATLAAQDAGDLVGGTKMAARLSAASSSRASAAASSVQGTLNQVSADAPTLQNALTAAQASAQSAVAAATTLEMSLPSTSQLLAQAQAALQTAEVVASVYGNYLAIVGTFVHDVERAAVDTAGAIIGFALGNTIGQFFEATATADAIFPASGDQHNLSDRGIATHEYGHFTLCNLLDNVDSGAFASMYDEAAAAGFITGQSASAAGAVLNESFADLMASQVVGGTNYAGERSSQFGSANLSYCNPPTPPATAGCVEDNFTNADSFVVNDFHGEILRDVSLFNDAFDGNAFPPKQDVPTNGDEWNVAGNGLVLAGTPGPAGDDDQVSLAGALFTNWIAHTAQRGRVTLREDNVFGGLNDAMVDQQIYNWCQRCRVFWLHTKDDSGANVCPPAGPRPSYNVPGASGMLTCTYEGDCPMGTTTDMTTETCDPQCPMGQAFDPIQLQCVPAIIPPG